MTVMEFKPYKINGEREKNLDDVSGDISIHYNFKVLSAKRKNTVELGDHLIVDFIFEVVYKPDIGKISLQGNIAYKHSNLDEMIIKGENDEEIKLNKESFSEISNALFRASLIELIEVSRKVYLPLPITLPKLGIN